MLLQRPAVLIEHVDHTAVPGRLQGLDHPVDRGLPTACPGSEGRRPRRPSSVARTTGEEAADSGSPPRPPRRRDGGPHARRAGPELPGARAGARRDGGDGRRPRRLPRCPAGAGPVGRGRRSSPWTRSSAKPIRTGPSTQPDRVEEGASRSQCRAPPQHGPAGLPQQVRRPEHCRRGAPVPPVVQPDPVDDQEGPQPLGRGRAALEVDRSPPTGRSASRTPRPARGGRSRSPRSRGSTTRPTARTSTNSARSRAGSSPLPSRSSCPRRTPTSRSPPRRERDTSRPAGRPGSSAPRERSTVGSRRSDSMSSPSPSTSLGTAIPVPGTSSARTSSGTQPGPSRTSAFSTSTASCGWPTAATAALRPAA